jgi:hypothetical protein
VAVAPATRPERMTWPTVRIKIVSGSAWTVLEPLGDPELDDGLPGNAEPTGFPVKRFDHPGREIHVHPALLQCGTADRSEIQVACHVFAVIKLVIELFSLHTGPPPLSGIGTQR